ncbi:MAG: ABC transporter permease subunit [Nitriliruptorales bacterium]
MRIFLSEPFLVLLGLNLIAAVGMNLVYITGQLNLGQAGFLAVGAYVGAVTDVVLGWGLAPSVAAGAVAAASVALPVAFGASRVRGIYLIMGTLAVGEVVQVAFGNIDAVGGLQGYSGMSPVGLRGVYAILALMIAASVGLMSSHAGLQMRSLFDDEDAAAAAGVPTRRIKIASVVISAAVVGVSGALVAKWFLFIAPRNFGIDLSFRIALFTLLGGVHSLLGAVAGAVGVTGLLEALARIRELPFGESLAPLARWRLAVYGGLVIVLMATLPEGIVGRRLALRLTAPARRLRRTFARPGRFSRGRGTDEPVEPGRTVLAIEDVSHRFGGLQALDGVTMEVAAGETVALVGANGAGKTTLVNVVAGRFPCQAGRVSLLAEDVTRTPAFRRTRRGICRTFQDVRVFAHLTVEETLRLGHAAGGQRVRPSIDDLVRLLGLEGKRDRLPGSLSLAERRRLEIGRALAAGPLVLFLDEPSAGMNEQERRELGDLIRSIASSGTAVVLVDHNLDLAFGVAERVVALDFGRVIAAGDPDSVLEDPRFREAYLGAEDRSFTVHRDDNVVEP